LVTAPAQTSPLVTAVRLSAKARRLAREHGVDVTMLNGSGPGGEVLANDVLSAAASSASNVPLTAAGRLMAERTVQSWTTIPHFFLTRSVDATALRNARTRLTAPIHRADAVTLTYTDLIAAAVARALREHPRMNASWADGTIAIHRHVDLALAIAVENAVVTAVIHDADRISLGAMAKRRSELTVRARAGRLQPADISGATFTISNLGMFDVDAFTAIIVPPQAGILAVGALADRPAVVDGAIAVRPTMSVTLSADHRVVDGAGAAAFLNDVVLALREPDKWL
jgi:pyruvate dehydrogenase E2 component (dihydrolipoamide acetyltransferase)